MRIVFNKTLTVDGVAYQAGDEADAAELTPGQLQSLRDIKAVSDFSPKPAALAESTAPPTPATPQAAGGRKNGKNKNGENPTAPPTPATPQADQAKTESDTDPEKMV